MTITKDTIKGIARALVSAVSGTAEEARADHILQGRYLSRQFNHTEIGTNVNLAESPIYDAKYAGAVLRARITAAANVAINTSNYVYLALNKSTGGAASTLVASLNTAVTALTKNLPAALTLNVNGTTFAANDALTLTATKYIATATGAVALTEATSQCLFGVDLEEGY